MEEKQEHPAEKPTLGQIPSHELPPHKPQENKDADLPKIRTMKQDAAHYLKDRNISFLDLVAKEHEYAKEHAADFTYHERVTEKAWFRSVLALVSLIFIGVIAYAIYVLLLTRDTLPTTESAPARSFIAVEERSIITIRDGDRAGLLTKLEAARRDRLPSRSIKHVVVQIESFGGTARFATAQDFFGILDFKLPDGFAENLKNKFDIVLYYRSDGADIGLLLEPKNTERAFAHMLGWEDIIILDFRNLYFDHDVSQPFHLFSDKIVRNIDTRSISLQENRTFSYAFFANRLLVITTSDELMDVLIGRLLAAPPR